MDVVNSMEEKLVQYQKEIYGLAVEKNAKEKEAKLLAEQRIEAKAKIQQNEGRERAIQNKIDELIEDAEEQDGVVRDLKKRLEEIEKNISAFEENIKLASAQIGENDAAARKAEAEIAELEAERSHLEKDLQTITDDIVAALDAGLKNAGYSAAERRRTEEAVAEVLQRLKTMLAGRETMLRDLAAMVDRAMQGGQAIQPSELRRLAESLAAALAEGAAQAEKAHELFESYRKASPSFIDEFLAPEGIITRKRALDEKINGLKEAVRQRRERIMALRSENDGLGLKIEEYRKTLEDLRVNRVRMRSEEHT